MDDSEIIGSVTVDLRKAFDILNHDIILQKLDLIYGCLESTVQWFSSYLKGRTQHVYLNGIISEQNLIRHGVPQGSILGPLLFVLYMNDLTFDLESVC